MANDARKEKARAQVKENGFSDSFMRQDLDLNENSESPSAFVPNMPPPPRRFIAGQYQNPYGRKKPVPPPQPKENSKNHNDAALAQRVLELAHEHGFDGMSTEKQNLVKNTKRGKNTKETETRKVSNENRFFQILKDHGGKPFEPLLQKVPVRYNGYSKDAKALDYAFFNVLGFSRDKQTHDILNKACIVVGLNLNKKIGKNGTKGDPFQPNSTEQFFRGAFAVLKRKGIQFDFDKDFNSPGEFHGVMKEHWASIRKVDKTFATNKERKRIKENVLKLACKAVREGVIKITNRHDVFLSVHFNNGLFLCFRGKGDHVNTRKEYLRSGVYDDDFDDDLDGKIGGTEWRGFFVPFSKTEQVEFGNTSLPPESERIKTMINRPDLDYNPVDWHDTFVEHMHPDAVGFYAYPYTEKESKIENARLKQRDIDWNKSHPECPRPVKDYDVWFKPSDPDIAKKDGNVSHNKHCLFVKQFCAKIGVQDAKKVASGHALRAKACTIMKGLGVDPHAVARQMGHKSIDTQKHYTESTLALKAQAMNAIGSVGVSRAKRKSTGLPVEDLTQDTPPSKKPARGSTLNTAERKELEAYRREQDPERKELERLRRQSLESKGKENNPPVPPIPQVFPPVPYPYPYPYQPPYGYPHYSMPPPPPPQYNMYPPPVGMTPSSNKPDGNNNNQLTGGHHGGHVYGWNGHFSGNYGGGGGG
ncbi:unknown protein (Partial), partial [Seminavis robusta]